MWYLIRDNSGEMVAIATKDMEDIIWSGLQVPWQKIQPLVCFVTTCCFLQAANRAKSLSFPPSFSFRHPPHESCCRPIRYDWQRGPHYR